MISTKIYSCWAKDPDNPREAVAAVQKVLGGVPVRYHVRIPVDPAKPLDPDKPLKVRFIYRKIVRVWQ